MKMGIISLKITNIFWTLDYCYIWIIMRNVFLKKIVKHKWQLFIGRGTKIEQFFQNFLNFQKCINIINLKQKKYKKTIINSAALRSLNRSSLDVHASRKIFWTFLCHFSNLYLNFINSMITRSISRIRV